MNDIQERVADTDSGEGGSMLDLIIEITNEKGSIVRELQINVRPEKDHLPIELWVRKQRERGRRSKEKRKTKRI